MFVYDCCCPRLLRGTRRRGKKDSNLVCPVVSRGDVGSHIEEIPHGVQPFSRQHLPARTYRCIALVGVACLLDRNTQGVHVPRVPLPRTYLMHDALEPVYDSHNFGASIAVSVPRDGSVKSYWW